MEGQDLLGGVGEVEEVEDRFLSLQRRAMLLPATEEVEEQEEKKEEESFYDEDDDNDSFITINTSDDENSDDTLENSESNDSGVIDTEFDLPHRSYGVNPIFAAQFSQKPLDGKTVTAQTEFKYVKNSKWKPAKSKAGLKTSNNKKKLPPTKPKQKAEVKTTETNDATDVCANTKVVTMPGLERFAYNESCLI